MQVKALFGGGGGGVSYQQLPPEPSTARSMTVCTALRHAARTSQKPICCAALRVQHSLPGCDPPLTPFLLLVAEQGMPGMGGLMESLKKAQEMVKVETERVQKELSE